MLYIFVFLYYIEMKLYITNVVLVFFFFFQAEDGIRDYKVTGVQTCALPILEVEAADAVEEALGLEAESLGLADLVSERVRHRVTRDAVERGAGDRHRVRLEIGRASCRERV